MNASGPPRTILVVDDDEAVRVSVGTLLEEEGYAVVTAADGRDALARLQENNGICLILLDLAMPVMDGWEFLAQREANVPRGIPIVLLSGLPFIGDAPGVTDFLTKPINSVRLLDCVNRLCRRRGVTSAGSGDREVPP